MLDSDAILDSDEMLDILLTPPSGLHGERRVLKDDKPLLQDEESSVFEKRDNSANLVTIGILACFSFFLYLFFDTIMLVVKKKLKYTFKNSRKCCFMSRNLQYSIPDQGWRMSNVTIYQ